MSEQEFVVRHFKFKSGEEIIACVHNVTDDGNGNIYNIIEPVTIYMNPQDHQQLSFVVWCMFANERVFNINSADLLFKPSEVDEGIVGEYHKRFFQDQEASNDSNIIIPNNNIILTQ